MAIAFLIFIWGLFVFIANADDQAKRKEGQMHMIYGIIGLSIMVGAWGILGFVDNIVQDINTTDSESVLETYNNQVQ